MDIEITPDLREKVNLVFDKFEAFKKKFEKHPYGYKQRMFFQIMEELQIFLSSFDENELCEAIFHSEKYPEYKNFFRHQNDYFMRAVETVEALDIINKKVGVDSSLLDIISAEYLKDRYLQKQHDLRLANIKGVKNVVMVGCGPFPDTILYLHENTDIPQIIGLDFNEEAIHISAQFIENLGFDRVRLNCIDGNLYDYKDADIIYIAGFVQKKYKILKRITETNQKENIQIIVDSALGMQKMLFDDINEGNLHPRLKIQERDFSRSKFYRQEMVKVTKYNI